MIEIYYTEKDNVKQIILAQLKKGMIKQHHDFVDKEGNPTDGTSGRLTFISTQSIGEPLAEDPLLAKLKNNTITFDEVKELLRQRL